MNNLIRKIINMWCIWLKVKDCFVLRLIDGFHCIFERLHVEILFVLMEG